MSMVGAAEPMTRAPPSPDALVILTTPRSWLECRMVHAIKVALFVAFLLAGGAADAADDVASAWAALRGDGHVALIRHASAPGPAGDPADYKLDDCATQRNLSEQGRAEARALGERFRT
jgi:hypothetical protein